MAKRQRDTQFVVHSLAAVAKFFDTTPSAVKDWRSRGMPGEPGTPGTGGSYDLAAVFRWWKDEFTDGADERSVYLERLRKEKWLKARLERLRQERQLLDRQDVHGQLGFLAGLIRGLGEDLQHNYGDEAAAMVSDMLDQFVRHVEEWYGDDSASTKDG